MAKKKKTTQKLKGDLQKIFNLFIRQRDSEDGVFTCISCGITKKVDQMNAGHFLPVKGYDGLRFDEQNVHGECASCNCWNEGHLIPYFINLQEKIGVEDFDALIKRGEDYKRDATVFSIYGKESKWHRTDVLDLIEHYKSCTFV